MKMLLLRSGIWATVLLAAGFSATARAGELRLDVGIENIRFGQIEVDLPAQWEVEGVSSYRIRSGSAADFVLLITPIPTFRAMSPAERCNAAAKTAEEAKSALLDTAEETEIPIRETGPGTNCVRYVSITDKTVDKPTLDDFKYGTQGAAVVGHLLVSFTILTNTERSPEVQAALTMLGTARHLGGPADPAAAATAATRLCYGGRSWCVQLDLSGFELEPPAVNDAGTGLRFAASSVERGLEMTIFLEPADLGNDPKAYRARYRTKAFAAAPFKREAIRESGSAEMPLLWYTNLVGELRHHNVNAFLARDGLWIDLHLSSTGPIEAAQRRFAGFLDSTSLVESGPAD